MSAQVTEAHRRLVRLISWAGISGKQVEEKAQLIADSEARAVADDRDIRRADNELGDWQAECHKACAERDELRAEVARLKNLLLQADELNEGAEFKISETVKRAERAEQAKARALRAEAELETIKAGHGELGRYEQLRLKNAELLHALKTIADMWIADTTPLAPPDALAERMGKLALAATLRKHP
ncbi:MAG: hypothetical protein QG602_2933 [Verrucomicrobiota bacterium]|nr:hypothetical protein [Verrucomicrobiota bacterium]